jgi:hypothetical protein
MAPRFERKYRLPDRDRAYLLEYWRPFLMPAPFADARGTYPVLSQYFDSPDLRFHREKHAGIGLRRKLRLRTYGTRFREGEACFLEIKRRTHETVSKLRVRLPGFQGDHLDPGRWSSLDLPGLDPFRAAHEIHRLRPSAQVLYLREPYEAVADADLRVTFDSMLMGLHPGEELRRDVFYDCSRAILPETEFILEIKGPGLLPGWVRRGIEWCELEQETVPKYVMAVEALNLVRLASGVHA